MSDVIIPGGMFGTSMFDSSWSINKVEFTFTYDGAILGGSKNTLNFADYGLTMLSGALLFKALSITGTMNASYNVLIKLAGNIRFEVTQQAIGTCFGVRRSSNQFLLYRQRCLLFDTEYKSGQLYLYLDPNDNGDYSKTANIAVNAELYFIDELV